MAIDKQFVLITGGNTGLGLAIVRTFAQELPGYHILLGTRSLSKGEAAATSIKSENSEANITPIQIDINSDSSIDAAVATVTKDYGKLDVLVNNAGIYPDDTYDASTENMRSLLKRAFETNTFGSAQCTESFVPLLKKSENPRIVFVSSVMGSLEFAAKPLDIVYDIKAPAYKASKAALNMIMLHYNMTLKDAGFQVNACCPGVCATSMNPSLTEKYGKDPMVGAKVVVHLATLKKGEKTGMYIMADQVLPW